MYIYLRYTLHVYTIYVNLCHKFDADAPAAMLLLSFPLNPRLRSLAFVVHGSLTSNVPKTCQRIRNRLGKFWFQKHVGKTQKCVGVGWKKKHGNSEIQG